MVTVIKKYIGGKTKVPVLGKVPNIVLGGAALLLLVGGYYFVSKQGGLNIFGGGAPSANTSPPASIYIRVVPDKVRPNDYITLAGVFLDENKEATTVPAGYYRVLEDDNTGKGTQNVKASGTLGNNISQFVIQISTNEYNDGKSYTVEVSDEPSFL